MKDIIVIPIPEVATDEELEATLAAPYEHDYFLAFMLGPRNGNYRAVFKRLRMKQIDTAEEEKAIVFLKAHPGLAIAPSVGMLAAKGIKRSRDWVSEQRSRMAFTAR